MFNWLRELYEIRKENKTCESCENLKFELAQVRLENSRLLDHILAKPVPEPEVKQEFIKPVLPNMIPWRVRQQMLEAEDRQKARLMKEHTNKEPKSNTVEELEKELGVE